LSLLSTRAPRSVSLVVGKRFYPQVPLFLFHQAVLLSSFFFFCTRNLEALCFVLFFEKTPSYRNFPPLRCTRVVSLEEDRTPVTSVGSFPPVFRSFLAQKFLVIIHLWILTLVCGLFKFSPGGDHCPSHTPLPVFFLCWKLFFSMFFPPGLLCPEANPARLPTLVRFLPFFCLGSGINSIRPFGAFCK